MEELTRTRSGNFTIEESFTLDEISNRMQEGTIERYIIPVEEVLKDYPRICCDRYGDRLLMNGNGLPETVLSSQHKKGWVRMCDSKGTFLGLYQWNPGRRLYQPVKMFL